MTGTAPARRTRCAASAVVRETEHLMATGHEDLDQLRANESAAPVTNVVAARRLSWASVECQPSWRPPTAPAQDSYNARTAAAVR